LKYNLKLEEEGSGLLVT